MNKEKTRLFLEEIEDTIIAPWNKESSYMLDMILRGFRSFHMYLPPGSFDSNHSKIFSKPLEAIITKMTFKHNPINHYLAKLHVENADIFAEIYNEGESKKIKISLDKLAKKHGFNMDFKDVRRYREPGLDLIDKKKYFEINYMI